MIQPRINRKPIYDDSPDIMEIGELTLTEGLSDAEYEEAMWMAALTKGVMIVTGDPRSGKDLFGNTFAWKMKRYFNKEVLRDEPPRELFGDYIPFTRQTIDEDLYEMHIIANGGETNKTKISKMESLAEEWLRYNGELLRDKIIYITEFSSWMYNRRALSPINIFMGAVLRRWGHYDFLVIGSTQYKDELDPKTCKRYITHEVRCKWSVLRENTGNYNIYRVKTITASGAVNVSRKVIRYRIDGGKPREALNGLRYFDLFNSKSALKEIPTVRRA